MNWGDYHRLREVARIEGSRRGIIHAAGIVQAFLLLALLFLLGMALTVIVVDPSKSVATFRGAEGITLARIPLTPPTEAIDPSSELAPSVLQARKIAAQAMLSLILAAGLVVLVLMTLLDAIRRWALSRLSARFAAGLRRQIHRQMYRFGQSSLPTEGMGPTIELFSQQVDDLRDGFRVGLDQRWRLPVTLAGLTLLGLAVGGWLTLFLIILVTLLAFLVSSMIRRNAEVAETAERNASMKMSLLQEDLGQIRTVRVFSIESVDNRRFDAHLEDLREADATRLRFDREFGPGMTVLLGISGTLALGMIGFLVIAGRLEIPAAILLLVIFALMVRCFTSINRMNQDRRRAARAATSVVSFLDRRPEILQIPNAKFLSPVRERIVLENVTVEGPTGRRLLEGVSLELPAGSKTAIMGRDEDSKQALVCLLPRLLDPRTGRVRMDGIDLREVTLESLRAQVATVFQSDLIFSDTIAFNIGLGDPSYDLPRLIEAAKQSHAHHIIQDLPEGYDTFVGPMGHYLRIDEQYRIALARAWLFDPSILIIEEPTFPIEDSIKPLIDDAIARLCRGRTVVFLAHRLSTLRACDRVVVLHNGRIEALGTAKELQATSKLYRHLQYVEFNQFAAGGIEAGQMQG
ncbi:ABC transporter ATP-binding protein [Tautonia marina]|uniref:ABC transporter ATP-binding protein n=1 Tax=Tautonia marina TaxID=2653855 RepID=UPI00126095C9|nr:ABC transporter ATP-binding protein [Tautonia marina]